MSNDPFESSEPLDEDELFALVKLQAVFPDVPATDTSKSIEPRIGRFEIRRILGEGTFGIVFEGWDTKNERVVAIKLARLHVSLDPQKRQRFFREADLASKLDHPGIARVYEIGEHDGQLFIAQEYCHGTTLSVWLNSLTILPSPIDIANLIARIANAIDHGHRFGIVHRDLKPENILVEIDENGCLLPRILDFGLAFSNQDALRQTSSSILLGTPLYMSPEHLTGSGNSEISAASDIFSLGSILYECLTGESPFAADTLPQVMDHLRIGVVERVKKRRPDIPYGIEAICMKCLRYDPKDRYTSAAELAEELFSFASGNKVSAKIPNLWARNAWRLRRPQHFQETALALIIINLIVLAWALINFPLVSLLIAEPSGESPEQAMFLPAVVAIIPAHTVLLWMSWKTYRRQQSKRGAIFHVLLTLTIGALAIFTICIPDETQTLSRFERVGALGLMSTFAEIQALLVVLLINYGIWPTLQKPNPPKKVREHFSN